MTGGGRRRREAGAAGATIVAGAGGAGGAGGAVAAAGAVAPLVPDAPALLVGRESWWHDSGLTAAMDTAGWAWVVADDVARARWLASIRRVALVVVAGDHAFRWSAVDDIRTITDGPLVVVADDADEVKALVRAGVDAVVPSTEPSAATLARLVAIVRRADHRRGPGVRYLRAGDLTVDLWTQECTRRGEPVPLSPIEYDLLTFFMTRPAVTIPIATIVRRVWAYAAGDGRNALRIVVNRLRRKLGDDPAAPTFIASVRGSGYRFVANVAEVADSLTEHALRADVTPLLDSLAAFADELGAIGGTDAVAAAGVLVDQVDRAGIADAAAVFRVDGERMHLVASRDMPPAWRERVAGGVPLDPSFASAHSVLSGEVVQFADVRAVKGQFGATAEQLAGEGFRACHFVPIASRLAAPGGTWGHLGLARRSPSPLDAVTMAYLRALCSTFLLHVTAGDVPR